jgi:hypothetical protein
VLTVISFTTLIDALPTSADPLSDPTTPPFTPFTTLEIILNAITYLQVIIEKIFVLMNFVAMVKSD